MKIRVASLVLVLTLILSLITVAFAHEQSEPAAEPEEATEVVAEAEVEETEPDAVFYLDGEPLHDVVAQCINGTYYVTLSSMMAQIDALAVVEEDGVVASLTAELVEVEDVEAQDETDETEPDDGEESLPAAEEEEIADGEAVGEAVAQVLDTLTLTAVVGEQYLVANGRYLYAADGIQLIDGSIAVPVRLLAKALDISVAYDGETKTVNLTSPQQPSYLLDGDQFYDADSLYWLSHIIYSESGNQCLAGRIAVGNVVLNRVRHPGFPSTIYDVIFQKNQFSPVANGTIYRDPAESSIIAAKLVLDGATVMENALFFNRVGLNCFASRNRTFVTTIGGHSFYA